MDKRTKKDLERLNELTNREKDLLKGLYGDMFGSSIRKKSKDIFEDTDSSRKPSAAELLDQARRKRPDPLEDAKKALREAEEGPQGGTGPDVPHRGDRPEYGRIQ